MLTKQDQRSECSSCLRSILKPSPDPQSVPAAVTQSPSFRSPCCRALCAPHSSRPSDPFRNRSEALDSLKSSPSSEESKVSATLLTQARHKPGPKGPSPGTHRSRCPNKTAQSDLGLSAAGRMLKPLQIRFRRSSNIRNFSFATTRPLEPVPAII